MALEKITDLAVTAISPFRIDLAWTNNDAYTAIVVTRNRAGAGYVWRASLFGNIEDWIDDECDEDINYCYILYGLVEFPWEWAPASDPACVNTLEALVAPSDVVATAISDIETEIIFKDNSENETGHTLEREIDEGDVWRTILELEPNREFFRDGGLFLLAAGYVDCISTDIGKQVSDDGGNIGLLIEYDNVRRWWLVDSDHTIANGETMTVVGGGGATGTIARETKGLNVANQYTYRVSVEGAGGPLGPVESNLVTMISAPAAPVLAAILAADIQDKSIRIRWSDVANETGYRIEGKKTALLPFVDDESSLLAVVGIGVTDFLATELDVNIGYTFRVRAYNAAGNSAFSGLQAGTTDAAYVPKVFEEWIRNPNIEPVYLAEIYTKMDLTDFVLEGGVTWKKTIDASDRGIDILEVFEDGTAYTEAALVGGELADPNTFWFDYDDRILYVHTTGGGDPADFLIEGAFWLYFSTHKDIEFTVNGRLNHYLPFLAREDIPDITQEIKAYFEGSFSISSGSVAFMNGKVKGEYFFDKKYANYTWENSKIVLKAGKKIDFTYANFETILTSLIDEKSCNDNRITFTLRDIRQEMERNLILNTFNVTDYPDIEEDFIGEPISLCFGTKYRVVPVPINIDRRKYKFHDGRSKSVLEVYRNWSPENATALIEDVDYFVDLQRSIITFERDTFVLGEEDIIELSFIGSVNSADEPIANGAEVFKYLMNQHYGLLNAELDLDSIYESKYEKTDVLSIFLYKDTSYREIVRSIEHSMEAFTFQDVEGRLGLRSQLAAAESKAKYIANHQIFSHLQSRSRKSLFWKVNVYYDENPQTQEWEVKSAQDDNIPIRYKNWNELNIYSYFSAPSSAQTLATNIKNLLNKEAIDNTVPMLLFDVMAGDIIKFSRDRFYSSAGTIAEGSEIDLRIIRISKSPASGKTIIKTEIV